MRKRRRHQHPPFLELDRLWLAQQETPGTVPEDAEEIVCHIESCPICQDYMHNLCQGAPIPAWATDWTLPITIAARKPRRPWFPPLAIAAFLAVMFTMVLLPRLRSAPVPQRALGGISGQTNPSAGLFVKRGPRIFRWSSNAALHPGDRFLLKIVPEGYTYLTIFAQSKPGKSSATTATASSATPIDIGDQHLVPIYQAPVSPTAVTTLPELWQVDGVPKGDALVLALSHGRVQADDVDLDELYRLGGSDMETDALWLRVVKLPPPSRR